MVVGACVLTVGLAVMAVLAAGFGGAAGYWPIILRRWFDQGITWWPSVIAGGLRVRRSARDEDRPTVVAAQFELSNGCWLIA